MGFLLVDKPAGITSHDVVDVIRRVTGIRKVGHAGTLDPFATGLLIVAVERDSTKRLGEFLKLDKHYRATIHFGAVSDTQDKTGLITQQNLLSSRPSQADVDTALQVFVGDIEQVPPMYSAKKIGGKKLYELARAGKEVERQPHSITIHSIDMISYTWPQAVIDVFCSSGTYIRTLCADIGERLSVGAYCDDLERTAIGPYMLSNAVPLYALTPQNWQSHLIDI